MFKDYYEILEVPIGANQNAIKDAYRKQALKWHPDKHPYEDVTSIMQDINEAYAILKDPIKRQRYDQEYANFKKTPSRPAPEQNTSSEQRRGAYQNHSEGTQSHKSYYYEYNVQDEDLKEDIKNAQEYARKLVEEFLSELKRNSKLAAEGAWNGAKEYVYGFIIFIFLGIVIRACVS